MYRKFNILAICILAIASTITSASATCYFTNLCLGNADDPTYGSECSSPLHSCRGNGNGHAELITDDYDVNTAVWYSTRTKLIQFDLSMFTTMCDLAEPDQIFCTKTDCQDSITVYGVCSTPNCACLVGKQYRSEFNIGVHSSTRGGPYTWTNFVGSWVGQPY